MKILIDQILKFKPMIEIVTLRNYTFFSLSLLLASSVLSLNSILMQFNVYNTYLSKLKK